MQTDDIAAELYRGARALEAFEPVPADLRPADMDQAHGIQDRYQDLAMADGAGPIAGWKSQPTHFGCRHGMQK